MDTREGHASGSNKEEEHGEKQSEGEDRSARMRWDDGHARAAASGSSGRGDRRPL